MKLNKLLFLLIVLFGCNDKNKELKLEWNFSKVPHISDLKPIQEKYHHGTDKPGLVRITIPENYNFDLKFKHFGCLEEAETGNIESIAFFDDIPKTQLKEYIEYFDRKIPFEKSNFESRDFNHSSGMYLGKIGNTELTVKWYYDFADQEFRSIIVRINFYHIEKNPHSIR